METTSARVDALNMGFGKLACHLLLHSHKFNTLIKNGTSLQATHALARVLQPCGVAGATCGSHLQEGLQNFEGNHAEYQTTREDAIFDLLSVNVYRRSKLGKFHFATLSGG
ncbi:hypothetical protein AVEN_164862-1 [Araneus ventricosus]|uniref:Uncharacterized protein n=1 Tax=Araneus ventricosus TaxID=182803 RepID=A0A4Y2SV57_ARAVE|nr:hypothetical protein AVEN_164862-1 [Araneus ventricosus]